MSIDTSTVMTMLLGVVALASAAVVVLSKEIMRMAVGLGTFLLSIAGFYLLQNASFLAAAQVFIYVGGVLVLMLFAIMLVQRSELGNPTLESRHDVGSAAVAVGLFVMMFLAVDSVRSRFGAAAPSSSVDDLSSTLLGANLAQFELGGLLLLIALVAVLVITGGEGE